MDGFSYLYSWKSASIVWVDYRVFSSIFYKRCLYLSYTSVNIKVQIKYNLYECTNMNFKKFKSQIDELKRIIK